MKRHVPEWEWQRFQRDHPELKRKSYSVPRWLNFVFRRSRPDLFLNLRRRYSTSAVDSAIILLNEFRDKEYQRLFDHYGTDQQGRLLTEPYLKRNEAERLSKLFAADHNLYFSVEPSAYHHSECTRIVFWPKDEAAFRWGRKKVGNFRRKQQ